jgi:hypothetical protein
MFSLALLLIPVILVYVYVPDIVLSVSMTFYATSHKIYGCLSVTKTIEVVVGKYDNSLSFLCASGNSFVVEF